MKRNSLTTAVMAGIAGVAGFASLSNAVELNADGLGQVLIYPYYTVNTAGGTGSQQTLVSVVNTTSIAKAVKVRFLEGYDSREVLDFNLFLSPFDVWTGTVFSLSDANVSGAGAALLTRDTSCTAPYLFAGDSAQGQVNGAYYASFVNFAYVLANDDGGPQGTDRTREGHIEMISMADLTGTLAADVTHNQSANPVAPSAAGCAAVRNLQSATPEMLPPSGGLFGAGAIVNVQQGTFYGYDADAIDGFTSIVLFSGTNSTTPQLADANWPTLTQAESFVFNNGTLITANYSTAVNNPVDAVSAVFASDAIYNEYNVDASAGSNTDWVVTFPTKRFYVDPTLAAAIPPFVELFSETTDGNSCTVVGINIYNREEGTTQGTQSGFSPPPPGQPPSSLCKEANVISFLPTSAANAGVSSGVLGSTLVTNIPPTVGAAGWARIDLNPAAETHQMNPSDEGVIFNGLPTTGFEAVNFVNANVTAGVLSNYSGLFRHRASRSCVNAATTTNAGCS